MVALTSSHAALIWFPTKASSAPSIECRKETITWRSQAMRTRQKENQTGPQLPATMHIAGMLFILDGVKGFDVGIRWIWT